MAAKGVSGDVEFPQCGKWWTRPPASWPGRSYGVEMQSLYNYVAEQRFWMQEFGGGPSVDSLPGRLRACLRTMAVREQVLRSRMREAQDTDGA